MQQKQLENEHALKLLGSHLEHLDSLDWESRQVALAEGILAGNVFDWGAKEVATLMENGGFGFKEAMSRLQRMYLE